MLGEFALSFGLDEYENSYDYETEFQNVQKNRKILIYGEFLVAA